jgi:hypothetical protein
MPSSAITGHMPIRREFLIISATIAIALVIYIPNIHIPFNNWTWMHTGGFDEAIRCYQKALELKGNSANIHNCLSPAYALTGQEAKAIYHFRASLHLEPGNPQR